MPLYEYECDVCSRRFEVIQKFSDAPVDVCPTCGGAVTRLISSPAIQFKGSGWYVTDYARAGKAESGNGGASARSDSGSASSAAESKGESKGESKSDASSTPTKSTE